MAANPPSSHSPHSVLQFSPVLSLQNQKVLLRVFCCLTGISHSLAHLSSWKSIAPFFLVRAFFPTKPVYSSSMGLFVCRLVWNLLGLYVFVPLLVGFFAPRMRVSFPNRMTSTAAFFGNKSNYITSLCSDFAFAVFNNPLQLVLGCFLSLPQSSQGQQEQRVNRNHREGKKTPYFRRKTLASETSKHEGKNNEARKSTPH